MTTESRFVSMTTLEALKKIQAELKSNSSESHKTAIQKFVPGSQKIYGVKNPVLNDLAKNYKSLGWELVNLVWKSGAYEERLLAAKLVREISKKEAAEKLKWVKSISKDISDWATCDTVGMQSLKNSNKILREEIFRLSKKLIQSKNLWERRLALVLVEDFTKDHSAHNQIQSLLNIVKKDDEYYVKKAVEWITRNMKKVR